MATLTPLPDRSLEQRRNALDRANVIRLGRAALKADIKALSYKQARERVAQLLDDTPSFIATMKVEDMLLMIPRFGESKVRRLLYAYAVSPRKRVGGLSPRQRQGLAVMLRSYTPEYLGDK